MSYLPQENQLSPEQVREALLQEREFISVLLQNLPIGVISTDEAGKILLVNPAYEKICGYSAKELVGQTPPYPYWDMQDLDTIYREFHLAMTGEKETIELWFTKKNGERFLGQLKPITVFDETGNLVRHLATLEDITQRKQAEEVLQHREQTAQAQVAELEKLNRLKDDFLSTVSHELRTPISNMRMAIQMLELSLNQGENTTAKAARLEASWSSFVRYLQILRDECEREIELVNDLLDLQQLDAGVMTLTPQKIHLREWILKTVERFEEQFQEHQQTLEIEIQPDLPTFVSDLALLERIVTELLHNAYKYTPVGERIYLKLTTVNQQLQLQVTNLGVEIPANELPRIFDRFYRIPQVDPWKQGGTGLGLAIVQKMVEQLGGSVVAISQNHQTSFTVSLPLNFFANR